MTNSSTSVACKAPKNQSKKSDNLQELSGYESLVEIISDNDNSLNVLVSGAHCAVCIQKIESALLAFPECKSARLNFSTGRLNIVWNGVFDDANRFVNAVAKLGYTVQPFDAQMEKKAGRDEQRFLMLCMGVAGFAMGNIMLLSVGLWVTTAEEMGIATREFLHWVSALIAIPAVIFSGRPFFRSALSVLKSGHTNMDVPISLAIILATGMSLFETMRSGEHVYFDSAVMLTFFLLVGRVFDFQARKNARSAATDLLQTLSGFASVVEDGAVRKVLIRDLREGMCIRIAAGEQIPVDGVVIKGSSSIDTTLVTGETLPRMVDAGGQVLGGTINLSHPLDIEVTKAAQDSFLSDVVRLMEKAEQGQAAYVRLADKAAKLYTPVVHTLAAMAFILWWGFWGADWQSALMISVTVLIITCPCALGLAVPVVQVLASGFLMKRGIMVKSGDALERLAAVDIAVFDKTGTLTQGNLILTTKNDVKELQLAASLASQSNHPLSRALLEHYEGKILELNDVKEIAGQGIQAKNGDDVICLGSAKFCGGLSSSQDDLLEIWLRHGNRKAVRFAFEDELREDSGFVIQSFESQNIQTVLLSGDRQNVVKNIAAKIKVSEFYGEQKPENKFNKIESLQREGKKVLMVGDGLNDAPVLAASNVSIAPGSAVDMAQNSADIVFLGDKLSAVNIAHKIAKLTQILVKQNFALAIIYNLIAVPMAFAGYVTPMIAALAMSGSSVVVIANSFRLKLSKD